MMFFSDNVTSKYFADDAKLYTEVELGDDIDDLQFSLDLLAEWALTWQLGVSFLKCSTIDIGRKKDCGAYCENSIEGQILVNKNEVTDLGIIFDSCLTFTAHINQIVSKAKQRIFLLYRASELVTPVCYSKPTSRIYCLYSIMVRLFGHLPCYAT